MSSELERLCAGLAGEGTTESAALGFTLESAKAREKLQEFALAQPENFQLLALAGLYALGCRNFEVTIDADDFLVRADHPLSREPFQDLWSFVSRGGSDSLVIGCRLLAMSILTSVRLGEMEWRVESRDAQGGWRLGATVRRGLLTERMPIDHPAAADGVLLASKRKALSQVARRFVSRWWSGSRSGADEALLRERLFLPDGATLTCNGQSLLAATSSAGVLAALTTGNAPTLVDCPVLHTLERDYTMTLLLCEPSTHSHKDLPGQANHTSWIWNGLRMDATVLGAELDCIRAFVWAPELRPDLSFTSLADTRDKQALERHVRSQARELLDRWVRAFKVEMEAVPLSQSEPISSLLAPFEARLAIVRNAIRERIDTRKDWRRYASLNRALFEFPLFLGSGPDGRRARFSLANVLSELQHGRPVAVFSDSAPEDIPPWPGRPLTLYTSRQDADFLEVRLPQYELASAEQVLLEVRERLEGASAEAPTSASAWRSGQVELDGAMLSWSLASEPLATSGPGSLVVTPVEGGASFRDDSLSLPAGFAATVRAGWAQSYRGGLSDRELAAKVGRALLTSFALSIPAETTPDVQGYALSGLLLGSAAECCDIDLVLEHPWLVVRTLGGRLSWMSPRNLGEILDHLEAPLYVGLWSFSPPSGLPCQCSELPIALVPKEAERGLGKLMKRRVHSGAAFSLLGLKAAPEPAGERALWSATLDEEAAAAVTPLVGSLRLDVRVAPEAEVLEWLWGRYLGRASYADVPPELRLCVDWARGWPNNAATQRLATSTGSRALKLAWMSLLPRFFQEAPLEVLATLSPDRLGGWMFDLLSDPPTAGAAVFTLGDGRRVSLAEVPEKEGVVRYFDSLAGKHPADAVFLPGPMREGIELVSSLRWLPLGEETPKLPASLLAKAESAEAPRPPSQPAAMATPSPDPRPQLGAPKVERAEQERQVVPEVVSLPKTGPEPRDVEVGPLGPPVPAEVLSMSFPGAPRRQNIPQDRSGLHSDLESELTALRSWGQDEVRQFAQFVRQARLDPSAREALRMEGDQVVLGASCERALRSAHGRKILLSALFSAFRQQSDGVGKEQALRFHEALLEACAGPTRPRL